MKKILIIGCTEYLEALRSKAFLAGVFFMPLLMLGIMAFQTLVKDQVDITSRRCAVIDLTGEV